MAWKAWSHLCTHHSAPLPITQLHILVPWTRSALLLWLFSELIFVIDNCIKHQDSCLSRHRASIASASTTAIHALHHTQPLRCCSGLEAGPCTHHYRYLGENFNFITCMFAQVRSEHLDAYKFTWRSQSCHSVTCRSVSQSFWQTRSGQWIWHFVYSLGST